MRRTLHALLNSPVTNSSKLVLTDRDRHRPHLMISQAHLKLTVLDIFRATTASDGDAYISKFHVNSDNEPILFKNCRVSGLVTEIINDTTFTLDDGTGLIPVTISDGSHLPALGQFVEVLGAVKGNISKSIAVLSVREQSDPMEEVRRLLEQAAIHRDNLKFRQSASESFLSSDQSNISQFEKLAEAVNELISQADPDKGVSLEEIIRLCGDEEVARKVVLDLQNQAMIYQNGDNFFGL